MRKLFLGSCGIAVFAVCPSVWGYEVEGDLPQPIGTTPVTVNQVADGVAVPSYSSNPGAAYTLYLNFGGFAYNGTWNAKAPGTTPAYTVDGDATTFNDDELTNIHNIWSRIAQKYSPFNINVTTLDPAVAAGQAGTDAQRQTYYDSTRQMMHTVIGGGGTWYGNAGGVSYVGVASGTSLHTNWVFAAEGPSSLQFVSEAVAHEDGHGLGLQHQSDYTGTTLATQYSDGSGPLSPTMGVSYYSSRVGLWSKGTYAGGNGALQNDVNTIVNDPNMGGYRLDGIGHTTATATHLSLSGNAINSAGSKGIIIPSTTSNPNPLGASNYTQDHWSFATLGGATSLTVNSGLSTFGLTTADAGATLDATLALYKKDGTLVTTLDTSNLSETFSGTLAAGLYDLVVLSHGGASDLTYTQRDFFDMGSYFLSGSIPTPLDGDANLDGTVNIVDLGILAGNWHGAGDYTLGDFNFDGTINIVDLGLLAGNWHGTAGSFEAAMAQFDLTAVPEPGMIGLAMVGLLLGGRRR